MRRVVVIAGAMAWAAVAACGGITQRQIEEQDPDPPSAGTGGKSSSPPGGQVAGKTSSNGGASGTGSNVGAAGATTIHPPTRTPASGAACFNDTDCPNPACGGEVCNWNKPNPQPVGDKPYTCDPSGTDPKGMDGWCTTDSNCKCQALGAKCLGVHCVFTQPGDAPSQ